MWNSRHKKTIIIVLAAIFIFGGLWKYKVAYENSAEYITVTIADKQVHTYHDENGGARTAYSVYTHGGEEFNVTGEGWSGGRAIFQRLAVNKQYTVLVAGLGITNRDILAATLKPQPVDLRPEKER